MKTKTDTLPLCTAGELLLKEFLEPFGLMVYELAKRLHVPSTRLHAIRKRQRAISPDAALRLERFFGLSEGYFQRLRTEYDLRLAKREIAPCIEAEVMPL